MVLPHLSAVRTQGKANVAQLVEQLIRNQQVTGSNPVVGSPFMLWHLCMKTEPGRPADFESKIPLSGIL